MSSFGSWYVIDNAERRRSQPNHGSSQPGYIQEWGYPIWQDEPENRQAYGTTVDPARWNVRDSSTFGETFDHANIQSTQVQVDNDGLMHIVGEWLDAPKIEVKGGSTASFATDNIITTSSDHGLAVTEQVYVVPIIGSGIAAGYYYVKTAPATNQVTLSAACDIWPGDVGAEYAMTGSGTCRLEKHRWMKTGYIDHRPLQAGDVAPVQQQYGRWEMRAKVPVDPTTTRGSHTGFWLRNVGTIVPGGLAGGEIDIMEAWGSGPTARYNGGTSTITAHNYTSTPPGGSYEKWFTLYDGDTKDVHVGYHTWTFEYTPEYARAYRDGVMVVNDTPATEPRWWGSTFTNPFHLRINMHIGSDSLYWGLPDPAHHEWSEAPFDFVIDYVRIWEYNG